MLEKCGAKLIRKSSATAVGPSARSITFAMGTVVAHPCHSSMPSPAGRRYVNVCGTPITWFAALKNFIGIVIGLVSTVPPPQKPPNAFTGLLKVIVACAWPEPFSNASPRGPLAPRAQLAGAFSLLEPSPKFQDNA